MSDGSGSTPYEDFRWQRRDVLLVVCASLLSQLFLSLSYGLRAHAIQLPRVFSLMDPTLYPGDMLVGSLEQYCSWFWVGVAWLSNGVDTKWILIGSHIVSRTLLIAAVFELTARMCPARPVRYIALAMLSLRLRAILATEALYVALPTHTTFAFPFLAWGLVMALRRKPIAAAVILGIACNCNVMTTIPAALLAAVAYFAVRGPIKWVPTLIGAVTWLLISAPALAWAMKAPTPEDSLAYHEHILGVFWWHFDPFRWNGWVYSQLAGLLLVLGIGIATRSLWAYRRPFLAVLIAIGLTWLLAVAAARWSAFAPLMRLQLGRTAAIAVILSVPIGAAALWAARERRAWLIAILLLVGWGLAQGRTTAVILLCWAIIAEYFAANPWLNKRRDKGPVVVAAIIAVGLFGFTVVKRGILGEDGGIIIRSFEPHWRDVQDWARNNTPKDAVFFAPIQQGGFRVFSHRSVWFAYDFDAMLWRPDLLPEISRRQLLVSKTDIDGYVNWKELRALAEAEGIDYAVVPTVEARDGSVVYSNGRWAVVSLR